MSTPSNDQVLIVTTSGTGNLHLLTYNDPSAPIGLQSYKGSKATTNAGKTHWLISFSYNYNYFAFIWDGKGEAVYRVGTGLLTNSVGTDWTKASTVTLGNPGVGQADVSNQAKTATVRDATTPVWIIPDII